MDGNNNIVSDIRKRAFGPFFVIWTLLVLFGFLDVEVGGLIYIHRDFREVNHPTPFWPALADGHDYNVVLIQGLVS